SLLRVAQTCLHVAQQPGKNGKELRMAQGSGKKAARGAGINPVLQKTRF
ncbi:hypothetical protein A2U01_0111024, partial [Trifolium medium]|nr:hypothetical protein [Trifolium medium]